MAKCSKCIECGEKEATMPERGSGSMRKRGCSDCHTEKLRSDLRYILRVESKRNRERSKNE